MHGFYNGLPCCRLLSVETYSIHIGRRSGENCFRFLRVSFPPQYLRQLFPRNFHIGPLLEQLLKLLRRLRIMFRRQVRISQRQQNLGLVGCSFRQFQLRDRQFKVMPRILRLKANVSGDGQIREDRAIVRTGQTRTRDA
jgi:hypothetical protein